MNILAVLGAVVLAVLSVPGESQSCPACWPRMVRGEAGHGQGKRVEWPGRQLAGQAWPRIQHSHHHGSTTLTI